MIVEEIYELPVGSDTLVQTYQCDTEKYLKFREKVELAVAFYVDIDGPNMWICDMVIFGDESVAETPFIRKQVEAVIGDLQSNCL